MVRVTACTAGLLALVVVLLAPPGSPASIVAYHGAAIGALVLLGAGALRLKSPSKGVWVALWLAQVAYFVGDAVYDLQEYALGEAPFPGWADPLYVLFYVAQGAALGLLIARRRVGRDREAWLDSAIMSAAAVTIVAAFILVPIWRTTDGGIEGVLALVYPLADVVITAALIALLVVGGWHRALGVVLLAEVVMLLADFGYDMLVVRDDPELSPGWLNALFLLAPLLMALAAWEPSAGTITEPNVGRGHALSRGRVGGLAVGVVLPSLLLMVLVWDGQSTSLKLLSLGSFVVIGLVVWRVLLLFLLVRRQQQVLAVQARTDPLTGLANRRTWAHESERAVIDARTSGLPLSVAMFDLDHFKAFNDTRGHREGDGLLIACAQRWRAALPPDAFMARYGGEEFAVLLPGLGADAAADLLETVREATPDQMTVSVGVAQWQDGESIVHTVDRADQALYSAKDGGRDQVRTYQGEHRHDTVG